MRNLHDRPNRKQTDPDHPVVDAPRRRAPKRRPPKNYIALTMHLFAKVRS